MTATGDSGNNGGRRSGLHGSLRGDLRENLRGIFGGTFDPIHRGHLAPVQGVARAADLSKVIYLPAADPPHRPPPAAAAAHRLAMVKIALAEFGADNFVADDMELQRRGPSFTFDSVQQLRRRDPRRRYALLLGLDALINLETWHRWRELQLGIHIIAIARPGWRAPRPLPDWWRAARVESAAELRAAPAGKIWLAEAAPMDLSASQIRARIRAGNDAGDGLLPGVLDYIREHNLYAEQHGE